jgi:squalene cyclase
VVSDSLLRAIEFILERQAADGRWRDFELEPGESDQWVTAYVGLQVQSVPARLISKPRHVALARAGDWLIGVMRPDGSWAYNDRCPPDCDSSAHAILFLASQGRRLPEICYERLSRFQKADGGFATYERRDPKNSWGVSHPDVTPVALRALLTRLDPKADAIQAGLGYVRAEGAGRNLWQSFWWDTPLYATLMNLRLLEELRVPYEKSPVLQAVQHAPISKLAFESALLTQILIILTPKFKGLATLRELLFNSQQAGGDWVGSAPLRVTSPAVIAPWESSNPGRVSTDPKSIFTTATAIGALAALLRNDQAS